MAGQAGSGLGAEATREAIRSPSGRGIPHLVSEDGAGHCSSCGRAVRLRLDGKTVTHKTKGEHCPGSGQQPDDDAPLACWLPVKDGLTPHGLRHSHKTWMEVSGVASAASFGSSRERPLPASQLRGPR